MKKLIMLSLILLTLCSCRKDKNEISTSVENDLPDLTLVNYNPEVETITASVIGFVINENGDPVADAAVTLNGNNTTTDERGKFIIQDVSMNRKGTFVQIEKAGYFPGSNRFFPRDGSLNQVRIILLDKTNIGSFSGSNGGLISSSENISLDFPANSIVNADGELHEGEVQVAARFIDPTDENIYEIMPGDLQGVNSNSEEVILSSFGMMAVELEDNNGAPLNLGNDKKASLSFPIPDELLSNASNTIPLWYFSDEYGIWVQQGEATLIDEKYVGEVSHFSFWNCDVPGSYIELSGLVVDDNGNPSAFTHIRLTVMSSGDYRYGATDANGIFSGKVPDNEVLEMEIRHLSFCNEVTLEIGPFVQNTDVGSFVYTADVSITKHITGTIVDCNNIPITNGYVELNLPLYTWPWIQYTSDGDFNFQFHYCDLDFDFTALPVNLDNLEAGDESTHTINNTNVDIGNIAACGNPIVEVLTITVDGVTTNFPFPSFYTTASDTSGLSGYTQVGSNWYSVEFTTDEITGTGTYDDDIINYIYMSLPSSSGGYLNVSCGDAWGGNPCSGEVTIEITEFGAVGEAIIGTFDGIGDFNNGNTTVTLPYSGSFYAIRQ